MNKVRVIFMTGTLSKRLDNVTSPNDVSLRLQKSMIFRVFPSQISVKFVSFQVVAKTHRRCRKLRTAKSCGARWNPYYQERGLSGAPEAGSPILCARILGFMLGRPILG